MSAAVRAGREGRGPCATEAPLACVVVNPSKRKFTRAVGDLLSSRLREAGFRGPVWLETSSSEPGATQARLAVASGAALVVAAGGDGTVRSVAAGLAGTPAQMGIVPLGTANLAARNLGLPTAELARAAQIAASSGALPCDLAWVSTDSGDEDGDWEASPPGPEASRPGRPGQPSRPGRPTDESQEDSFPWARPTLGREHACMVVAGIGFDAGLVASTSPALKARIGWGAYAVAAMGNLRSPRMDLVLSLDGPAGPGRAPAPWSDGTGAGPGPAARPPSSAPPPRADHRQRRVERMTARSLLVANGGRLPAGITLLPQARLDDGMLDIAAIDTVAGLVGWGSLARQVLPPSAAAYANPQRATGRVLLRQGNDVIVRLATPAPVEVDGDLLAPTRGVHVRLEPGALRIRRP